MNRIPKLGQRVCVVDGPVTSATGRLDYVDVEGGRCLVDLSGGRGLRWVQTEWLAGIGRELEVESRKPNIELTISTIESFKPLVSSARELVAVVDGLVAELGDSSVFLISRREELADALHELRSMLEALPSTKEGT